MICSLGRKLEILHEKCIRKVCKASVVTGKALYIKELVIHITADQSTPKSVLPCMSSVAFRLCCAAEISGLQDQLRNLAVAEEPAGSSHLVPVITPPAWPHL